MATISTIENTAFLADVFAGLAAPRKHLKAKYFYDDAGSRLFDRITELDEYYLTRIERCIMRSHAGAMAARCGPHSLLIEFGAGSLLKVRLLLDQLPQPAGYVPVDVSGRHLRDAAAELSREYPRLTVLPVCADFTRDFPLPLVPEARRTVYFPGSTLGNFEPTDADALLRRIAGLVGPGGGLLLGLDLRKDPAILEAAYNDRAGVTAAFNGNLLVRINRELAGEFERDAFSHRAFYNRERSRVEMHLVSRRNQCVRVGDHSFEFRKDETIHTENSYKYDLDEFRSRAGLCGWRLDEAWMDEKRYFAVLHLSVHGSSLVVA